MHLFNKTHDVTITVVTDLIIQWSRLKTTLLLKCIFGIVNNLIK